MSQALPWIFATLASAALFATLYALWASLRVALIGASEIELGTDLDSDAIHRLSEEKDALLQNLRDLRFDHEAGKLSDADFGRVEGKLRERAKIVMRLLDEKVEPFVEEAERLIAARLGGTTRDAYRQAAPDAPNASDARKETPEEKAERHARRRRDTAGHTPRSKSQRPSAPDPEDSNADAGADSSAGAKSSAASAESSATSDGADSSADSSDGKSGKSCPSCEASNDADAVFCKKCGYRFDAPDADAPAAKEVDR